MDVIDWLLDADPSTEVAVLGAVWVNAPIVRYVAAVNDIENFEKGENFLVTKKIGSPPTLDDFARLTVPKDDFDDLKSCRVGSCEIKLGHDALTRLKHDVDWSRPSANADVDRAMQAPLPTLPRGAIDRTPHARCRRTLR